jgi:eukaryotic-like serine/threonine-protein kinase
MYRCLPPVAANAPPLRSFADRFDLKSQAGTGGMGTVYQATDRETGEMVAVKVLHGKSITDAARFDQEASLLAELRHPGVVRYVNHGVTAHGESYIAMEWLSGETLEERLTRGPLPAAAVARLGRRVLEAVSAAHERGIIHRDLKPSNIFLVDWRLDDTRILDFGIARRVFDAKRFTKVGSTVGTPMYTAPEQARGDRDVDGRADVFSLGCVLFECLAGEPPFTGESPMEVMAKICIGAPPRLASLCSGLPPALEQLVESMLAQDRRERPIDPAKLAESFAVLARQLVDTDDDPVSVGALPTRGTLSDGEHRVMCGLLISERGRGAAAAPTARPRPSSGLGDTAVLLPALLGLNDTGVQRAVEPFGGHVDQLLDRSLIITLPTRGLLREQAVQVARCALALRSYLPTAAMAISTGRAALLAKLPVGPLLDRLAGLVAPERSGAIRIDEMTAGLLPARFIIDCDGEKRLVGEGPGEDRPRQIGGRIGPFLGRDRELGTLVALYHDAVQERVARVALVLAGIGAGKTRLHQELLRAVRGEASKNGRAAPLVLSAAGDIVRSDSRYPLLGGLLVEAGIDLDASNSAAAIQDAWIEWLRARCAEGPVLLLLEDMQWADLECAQFVDTTLRLLRGQPLFVLGLGRPEVDEQFPGLWSERAVERLRLPPLGRKAGQLLVRHFLDEARPDGERFVLDRWEGNPFFLEELVTAVRGNRQIVPETVLGLVEARFDDLEPEVRRVLRAASVFGDEPFAPEGVVALLGEKSRRDLAECLDILVARDILEGCRNRGEEAFIFKSQLIREAAYRLLPPGDRALGRRLARTWLENAGRTLPAFLVFPLSQTGVAAAV